MKLWLISQTLNNDYDTYDSAVVAAETEEEARFTHPEDYKWSGSMWLFHTDDGQILNIGDYFWVDPKAVDVKFLADGYDGPAGTVLGSFNAG